MCWSKTTMSTSISWNLQSTICYIKIEKCSETQNIWFGWMWENDYVGNYCFIDAVWFVFFTLELTCGVLIKQSWWLSNSIFNEYKIKDPGKSSPPDVPQISTWRRFAAASSPFSSFATCQDLLLAALRSGGKKNCNKHARLPVLLYKCSCKYFLFFSG